MGQGIEVVLIFMVKLWYKPSNAQLICIFVSAYAKSQFLLLKYLIRIALFDGTAGTMLKLKHGPNTKKRIIKNVLFNSDMRK